MKIFIIAIIWMAAQSVLAAGISIDPATGIDVGGKPVTSLPVPQLDSDAATKAYVDALNSQITALNSRITALESLLEHFTRAGDNVYVTGANLHIRNGLGGTIQDPNGVGNLIVGYNEERSPGNPEVPETCSLGEFTEVKNCMEGGGTWALNHKSGSHNVIVGAKHNYSRWGGIAAGFRNTISGPDSSVSGGLDNIASGVSSSVSAGRFNIASGDYSSVSGGYTNTASLWWASVSGGQENTASGVYSSVSGGRENIASGPDSSVSGGRSRSATGTENWAAGSLSETN